MSDKGYETVAVDLEAEFSDGLLWGDRERGQVVF